MNFVIFLFDRSLSIKFSVEQNNLFCLVIYASPTTTTKDASLFVESTVRLIIIFPYFVFLRN